MYLSFILFVLLSSLAFANGISTPVTYCENEKCDQNGFNSASYQDPISKLTSGFKLKDCSCKANITESNTYGPSYSDRKKYAQSIQKICECYFNQSTLSSLLVDSSSASQVQLNAGLNHVVDGLTTEKNMTSILGYIQNGPEVQAMYVGQSGYAIEPNLAPTNNSKITSERVKTTAIKSQSQPNSNISPNSQLLGTKLPTRDIITPLINERPQELSVDNCVSMRHYLMYNQTPGAGQVGNPNASTSDASGDAFYKFLASNRSSPFVQSDWDMASLFEKKKERTTQLLEANPSANLREDDELKSYTERIKFLYSNPIYSNIFSAQGPAALVVQSELAQNIFKNFAPADCKGSPALCAVRNSKSRLNWDKEFFGRDAVKNLVKSQTSNGMVSFIANLLNKRGLYSRRDHYEDSTDFLRQELPDTVDISQVQNNCAMVKDAIKEFNTSDYIEGDFRNADLVLIMGDHMNLDPEKNDDFKSLKRSICQSTRCRQAEPKDGCVDPMTFGDFYKKQKPCSTDKCWMEAERNYLEKYPLFQLAPGLAGSDSVGSGYAEYLKHALPDTRTPVDRTIISESPVDTGTTQSSFISYDEQGGFSSYSTSAPDYVREKMVQDLAAFEKTPSTPAASTVSNHSTDIPIASPEPKVATNETNYVPYVNLPIPSPAEIPQVTADAKAARVESNQLESQANALASQRAVTTDFAAKSAYDAQITALTERANAADTKANSLEALLRAAEKANRAPTSATASSAGSNVAESGNSSRTAVASNFSNPVFAPTAAPQIQPLSNLSGGQSFGSGASSINIPISAGASTSDSSRRSNATNFSFKYGSDAKIQEGVNGLPSIIVAGSSSSFNATKDLAAAVSLSTSVNIGDSIPTGDSQLLSSKDLPTISKYLTQHAQDIPPGAIVRLTYSSPGQPSQELVVAKDRQGRIFFPAVRRLAQMRAALTVSTGN